MSKILNILDNKPTLIPAVVCFPVRGDEVLLMHRIKTSDGLGQDLVSGIGGKIGDEEAFKDETAEEALIREVQEEVCIVPTQYKKMGRVRFLWETEPQWNMDVLIYLVTDWNGQPSTTNVAKPVWHKINELPIEQMWEDNAHWVHKVLEQSDEEYNEINGIFLYGVEKNLVEHLFI